MDKKRYMMTLATVEVVAMTHTQVGFIGVLAVVGCDDHNGIVQKTTFLEVVEEVSYRRIRGGNSAAIEATNLSFLGLTFFSLKRLTKCRLLKA